MALNLQRFYGEFDLPVIRRHIQRSGFYLFEARIDREALPSLRARIDALSERPETEIHYGQSEHRVWQAEKFEEAFAAVQNLSNWIMPQLYQRPSPSHTTLAIRNRPAPPDSERMTARWHLDSFQKQLKLFAFLSDVSHDSGPLEYIPRTQKAAFKWAATLPLGFYRLKDLAAWKSGKRSWQRIHDRKISRLVRLGYQPHAFTVPAGSVLLVDTSGLHRAKPCVSGERYAITVYHR